jgi:WD40 repeat protein
VTSDSDEGLAETQLAEPSRVAPAAPSQAEPAARSAIGSVDSPPADPETRSAIGSVDSAPADPAVQPTVDPAAPTPGSSVDCSAGQLAPSLPDATRTSQPDRPAASPTRPVRPAMPPQLRDHDRYDILGEHGRGGLGRVSRAHDRELGRDIAIKELISRGHLSEVRFLREALITARLEHPGIVPVYEAGRWPDGTPFYAMKLVSGRPLRDLIAERKTVDERIGLLHHVIAVADAIAYAHGRNIIHRDLKPANVIVGDFGETVVIDWGLAKDLTAAEGPTAGGGPFRAHRADDGLTSDGVVLGTPTYMAPEQARGEAVDQRADVFAIGVMLWELGTLRKLTPSDTDQRARILRESGIDQDLVAIITKAVDPDRARRYPDAGALAADLKAFTAGARIASRRYSLWGLLTHWTRRHRMLALTATCIAALAASGIVVYVQNISAERDRADVALSRTEAARNDLALEHAELLLQSDPTAAFAALSSYRGKDDLRRHRLLAEAVGLGVARRRFQPHTDAIWFLLGDKDGRIVSVGEDGRLKSTRADTSELLADDLSLDVRVAYAPSPGILAYATSPTGVALVRLRDRRITHINTTSTATPQFSPDGSHVAILSDSGELILLSVLSRDPAEMVRARLSAGTNVRFMTPTRILAQDNEGLRIIALDSHRGASDVSRVGVPDIVTADAQPDAVVIGKSDGTIALLSASLNMVRSMPVCRVRVNTVQFVPNKSQIAFCCHDGYSGLIQFEPALTAMTVVDVFPTHGSTQIAPDATGRYIAITDESRTAYLFDNETRLTHRYEGHAARPTYVAPPTEAMPYVLTGDKNGTVRIWDSPTTRASLVLRGSAPLFSLVFSRDSQILLANGYEPPALGIQLSTRSTFQLPGGQIFSTQIAPDSSSLLTYGYDGTIRVWRGRDLSLTRSFTGHKGLIGEVDYLDPDRIVSVGDDGQLLQWSPQGTDVTELFKCGSPLRRLEILRRNQHIVVYDKAGGVWDIAPDHKNVQVRAPDGTTITLLRASHDGKYLAVGTDTGLVAVYDTASWRLIRTVNTRSNVRQIVFDPQDRDLVVASEASHDQPGGVRVIVLEPRRTYRWTDIDVAVRDLSYAPDGDTLGFVTADGSTWLYAMTKDAWSYSNDARIDTFQGKFSPDGRFFATADQHGDVIIRDVAASFQAADIANTTLQQPRN